MTQVFDEVGDVVPVTVIQAGPCVVIQKKTSDRNGYDAIQVGFGEYPEKKATKLGKAFLNPAFLLMALGIAFAFRLSRAAVLVGIYVNNPWTIAPMYVAGTTLGCWILGVPLDGLEGIHWDLGSRAFYHTLLVSLRPYLWPYVIGNTILGIVCGYGAYLGMRWLLERRARHRAAAVSGGAAPGGGGA